MVIEFCICDEKNKTANWFWPYLLNGCSPRQGITHLMMKFSCRVPTTESHLRQLGDQMYNNRMRLLQAIPETPPSPRSPEPAESPSFRRNSIKRFSFRKRTRKPSESHEGSQQDFDTGAFANHLMAENCIGNLKVRYVADYLNLL